ncbi:MAG: exosortase/archaeosortase family protein [Verrucomicrobiales bacterium]|nr:exosortase/archaeosortase family protein [Verrucomicrobiales bacterium]
MDLQVHWRALPEFQHGWLVPVLAGYLAWERWGRMAALATTGWWLGPVLVALASAPWLLVAELYKRAVANTPTASFCLSVGCCGFIVALLWLQCGWRIARGLLFPLLFVFVAVPMPVVVWGPLVQGLQSLIAGLNVETLNLLGIPAERTGNILRLPTGQVGVDEACSGVRSLQSSIMAALFIADLVLGRIGPRILFLVAGVILAIVGNFGRSLYLALTASRRGVDAVAGVHDAAGWSVFVFTSTATGLLAWWLVRAEARARRLAGGTH